MGFWSKIDPVGQPAAVTFPSEQDAQQHIAEWDGGRPDSIRFVEVVAGADGYASIAACVAAGLPGWVDEITPVANTLPA